MARRPLPQTTVVSALVVQTMALTASTHSTPSREKSGNSKSGQIRVRMRAVARRPLPALQADTLERRAVRQTTTSFNPYAALRFAYKSSHLLRTRCSASTPNHSNNSSLLDLGKQFTQYSTSPVGTFSCPVRPAVPCQTGNRMCSNVCRGPLAILAVHFAP